jgi:ABC-type multidrug transport system ATPase subunit
MNVKINELSKTYAGGLQALRSVSLEIGTGMFGLLGPNGAGKTTLLRILATLLKPSHGWVTVDGFDVTDRRQKWAVKQLLGYLPQELGLYPSLSVTEFLDYIATLKNLHHPLVRAEAVGQVISQAGLRSVAHQRIRTLSGGMKRRVGIAQALLGDPRLLIVDEPTAGLDPEERVRFRNLLARLSADRVVILSTHIVEDIAATCHDMAVLHLGQLRFRGSPAELIRAAEGQTWEIELPTGQEPSLEWRIASRVHESGGLKLRLVGPCPDRSARPVKPTLEEAYLILMGEEVRKN